MPKDALRNWTTTADLMRIDGLRGEHATMLQAAGIESIQMLAGENPSSLARKMRKFANGNLSAVDAITEWVTSARKLHPMIRG